MRRRGFTLIETMTTVFVAGVLGSLLVVAVGKFQLGVKASSKRQDVEQAVWRLGEQFREDVHRAKTAALATGAQNPSLVLTTPNGIAIEYAESAGLVTRLEMRGSQIESRSEWRLYSAFKTRIAFESDHRLLVLLILESPLQKDAKTRETRILACIGFDQRFEPSRKN